MTSWWCRIVGHLWVPQSWLTDKWICRRCHKVSTR